MAQIFPGIGVGGYRSFGKDPQILGPLDEVNLVIGPNNSGKSNFLRAYHEQAPQWLLSIVSGKKVASFNPSLDAYDVEDHERPPLTVLWPIGNQADLINKHELFQPLLESEGLLRGTDVPWFEFSMPSSASGVLAMSDDWVRSVAHAHERRRWAALSSVLTSTSGGGEYADVRRVLDWIIQNSLANPPHISYLPAHREVRGGGGTQDGKPMWDLTGLGLIDRLDDLKNASHTQVAEKRLHQEIRRAMADLLEVEAVEYNVSRPDRELELIIEGHHRPLASFGTGYEHALMILMAVMTYTDHLFCIEEPEVHLHPRLQRQLGLRLRKLHAAQVVISSHSAHMIDALGAKLFRTELVDYATRISAPIDEQQVSLLDELGYRASDLMQTNCILWVEGPSDRVYLNAWLHAIPEGGELVEGVHYTIMYYGGALLDRLAASAEGGESSDRVPFRRMQQHFVVVADSDKQYAADELKRRVIRVATEAHENPTAHVWITEGREIENYVPAETLEAAVKKVHPSVVRLKGRPKATSDALFAIKRDGKRLGAPDKVAIAEEVVLRQVQLDCLDLRHQVEVLTKFIRAANA